MKLHLVITLPDSTKGYYSDYYSRETNTKNTWTFLNVKQQSDKSQKEILDSYLEWHQSISEESHNIVGNQWWMMQESRLISWHPDIYEPIVYAACLSRLCSEKNIDEIYILNLPRIAERYLEEFGHELVYSDKESYKKNYTKGLTNIVHSNIQLFLHIFKQIGSFIKTKMKLYFINEAITMQDINNESYDLIVSQVSNNHKTDYIQDHFFGSIKKSFVLKNNYPLIWVLRPMSYGREVVKQHIELLKRNGFKALILERHLTIIDVLFAIFREVYTHKKIRKHFINFEPISIFGFKSNIFIQEFFDRDTRVIDGFIFSRFFRKLIKKMNLNQVIYPYEEKVSERAILQNIQTLDRRIVTIGYQHASTNQSHLFLQYNDNILQSPKPNKIYTTGISQKDLLCNYWNWPENKVKVLGSFRFHEKHPISKFSADSMKKSKVLLIIGQGYELARFEEIIKNNYHIFEDIELMIRPYPYSWVNQQKDTLLKISKDFSELKVSEKTFEEDVLWSDYTLSCSSSSGIESILLGRINAYINLNNYLIQDPYIDKFDEKAIFRINSIYDLQGFLNFAKKLNADRYNTILNSQIDNAKKIYSDPLK